MRAAQPASLLPAPLTLRRVLLAGCLRVGDMGECGDLHFCGDKGGCMHDRSKA